MSVTKVTKEIYKCKCDHHDCQHKWETDKVPARCAKCKRRTWNRPARLNKYPLLTFKGKTQSVWKWGKELGFAKTTIPWRLKQGWPIEQVLAKDDWRLKEKK